jgi:hypothetical protein
VTAAVATPARRWTHSKYRDRPYVRAAELARRTVTRGRGANVRLRTQARAAARAGRPVAWLALVLYRLAAERPKGASKTTGQVAALMVASADFRSGARTRPGRAQSAGMLGVSDRTVERHWRIIEGTDAAVLTEPGDLLSADERAEVAADPEERDRWRDRQEWRLVIPGWVAELPTDVDMAPYERQARQLLAEIAYTPLPHPAAPAPAAGTQPVDNAPGADVVVKDRVAPSPCGEVLTYLPHRCQFSRNRPSGRGKGGAASRRSPTKNGSRHDRRRGRRLAPEAVVLARELLEGGRLPWLRGAPLPMVAATLSRLATAAVPWTALDVKAEADRRLASTTFSQPAVPAAPVAYLRWLLAEADPARPPVQARDQAMLAEADQVRERMLAARREHAERTAAAVPAAESSSGRAALQIARHEVAKAAARRAAARRADDAARAEAVAAATATREPAVCGGGCHTVSTAVRIRLTPTPVPLCPDCWEAVRHAH